MAGSLTVTANFPFQLQPKLDLEDPQASDTESVYADFSFATATAVEKRGRAKCNRESKNRSHNVHFEFRNKAKANPV